MKILGDVLDENHHHIIIPPLITNDANGVDGVFSPVFAAFHLFHDFSPLFLGENCMNRSNGFCG